VGVRHTAGGAGRGKPSIRLGPYALAMNVL
jgi:hypothetical protein